MNHQIPDKVFENALNHFVAISFQYQKDEKEHNFALSSFVLSVKDQWFFVTAGHCFRQINQLEEIPGVEYKSSFIVDCFGSDSSSQNAIPFCREQFQSFYINDQDSFDFGFVKVDNYLKRLLVANGIVALGESYWESETPDLDFAVMVGISNDTTKYAEEFVGMAPLYLQIKPLFEKPEGFPNTNHNIFYAEVQLPKSISDLAGMSGSPIFGVKHIGNSDFQHWIMGVQSGWVRQTNTISICPVNYLTAFLKARI